MKKNQIENALLELISDTFDDDNLELSIDTKRENIEAWNSLGHIRLLTTIEEEFNVKFDLEEIESIDTIQQILDIILTKRNET